MKPLLLLAGLLFAGSLSAQPVAVFARNDSRVVGSAVAPTAAAQAAFWADYGRDHAAYEAELPLVNPPAWGKTVSAKTGGTVRYHSKFRHGFVCRLELHDLQPSHAYLLTLNGNPERAGNALLPTPVTGNEREKYYDFLDIKTDAQGRYAADLGIYLEPGDYDVRIYAKDTDDFKIVLYRDFFKFAVE